MTRDRYFLALLPPSEIQAQILPIQQDLTETYSLKRRPNSPPHITLYPPFEWDAENVPLLIKTLQTFTQNWMPIPIQLTGFGAFKPRVIFIQPRQTSPLMELQRSLKTELETQLHLEDINRDRAFSPHITVAFCDRRKSDFSQVWLAVKNQEFNANFTVARLTLLIYQNRYWHLYQEFEFSGSSST
ncbi:MAG: RNA 2',3'-cyclic phosphodiesterase [Jaaginema sp. PMC 1079.18]|nr:RNA 2',3'-cyclic phosphodiesterase [Jaaginema sp. PMC 1080.18]MEC4850866.1 RNA 2',3'-cyclic phosphodiesterase [Jaaginema sp. PMC 1079.18]MEC4866262.1 RNA 2',3'-cyclic phosphodiesterase [Jaaginema sp. PMC 1078.18]